MDQRILSTNNGSERGPPVVSQPRATMDAENKLRKVLQSIAKEQKYTDDDINITPITSGGANYTCALFLASITSPPKEQLHLFAKVAIISAEVRSFINGDRIFNTERFVYTELRKDYEDIQEKHGIRPEDRLVFPKFYGYSATYMEETIVLENLVASGYSSYNRFKSFNWEYAAEAITKLAKLHALSFACQEEQPEKFEKILEERIFPIPAAPKEDNPFLKMLTTAYDVVKTENKERLQKYIECIDMEDFGQYYSPRGKPVLAHGDYKPSNLMCRKTSKKLEVIPLDYQIVHAGCPVHDLLYFIFIGSDRAFRKLHYQRLIDHYFNELQQFLKELGQSVERIYPREQFDKELKEALPYGLIVGVFVLPVITVEEENAPKLSEDIDSITNFKTNDMYSDRFNGIVDDFVDWGLL